MRLKQPTQPVDGIDCTVPLFDTTQHSAGLRLNVTVCCSELSTKRGAAKLNLVISVPFSNRHCNHYEQQRGSYHSQNFVSSTAYILDHQAVLQQLCHNHRSFLRTDRLIRKHAAAACKLTCNGLRSRCLTVRCLIKLY